MFERDVRPVLKAYCLDCHGASETPKGGLDLRLARFALRGGKGGPAVAAGQPEESMLVERMRAGEMPPGEKKVPAAMIATIETWIAQGCRTSRVEPESLPAGIDITPEDRAYWFFEPLRRPQPPTFAPGDRVRTPIDAFVLARLRERGLAFNPDADRATLLRRASLDLTGLPPTIAEVDAFLKDTSADAYERAVDRLLDSPRYGERWGRHWLDVAGYADSDGDGVTDTPRPHAWRYRDYVVKSLNADKPFDRFVLEQLAGDELVPRPWANLTPDQVELLAATGFLRNAPDATASGGGDAEANQVVADTLKIVGSTFLGLSVGCAQCHDHRYDPIPQSDYFRLRAVFEPALDPAHWRRPGQRLVSLYTDADRARAGQVDAEAAVVRKELEEKTRVHVRAAFDAELAKFPADQRDELRAAFDAPGDKRTPRQKMLVETNPKLNISAGTLYQYNPKAADELKSIDARIAAKLAEKPVEQFVAVADETPGVVPVTKVFYRGDYRQPKGEVSPGDLTIAAAEGGRFEIPARPAGPPTTGRRLAYARHLTSGTHPLVGRVLANRLWLGHFGAGIVETPGEFGKLGRLPSHPELLDWIASELPARGWSLKAMHRLVMTSTVYRQSSTRDPAKDKVDSSNALFGRYPAHRLEAEVIRDRLLWTAGKLDGRVGGPPVPVSVDAVGQVVTPADAPRRSLYLQQRRTQPVGFLAVFDGPSGELNCDRRLASTGAPQALMLMNSEFLLRCGEDFARRLQASAATTDERISLAWRLAYQRDPSAEERAIVTLFWNKRRARLASEPKTDAELGAWSDVCQQILSANEVLYVD
ncbi:MAG: PSD1 and planctomycete cytochrome C domain-containing protein [Isosphaeraceae bacterium]|nr:PSD1 and planctomycete cytochrome C domain-containing protein [Isosphaeraceae bacterium]